MWAPAVRSSPHIWEAVSAPGSWLRGARGTALPGGQIASLPAGVGLGDDSQLVVSRGVQG